MELIKHKVSKMVETKAGVLQKLNPNYEFVDVVDSDLHDVITSIETIYAFGLLTGRDYITFLTEIKTLIISKGGFSGLTEQEKNIISRLAMCTDAEALTVGVTSEQFDTYIDTLADKTRSAREKRVELARKDFSKELKRGTMTYTQSNSLLIDTRELFNDYMVGNNPAFIYFITDTNGYESTGFSSKAYYTADRRQRLIDRIVTGL